MTGSGDWNTWQGFGPKDHGVNLWHLSALPNT